MATTRQQYEEATDHVWNKVICLPPNETMKIRKALESSQGCVLAKELFYIPDSAITGLQYEDSQISYAHSTRILAFRLFVRQWQLTNDQHAAPEVMLTFTKEDLDEYMAYGGFRSDLGRIFFVPEPEPVPEPAQRLQRP